MFRLLFMLPALLWALPALAQSPTVMDYSKASLAWTEPTATSTSGIPTSYTLKCGPTKGGPYTLTKNYPIGGPETVTGGIAPLSDLITTSGTYFCVVSASNSTGESAPSTETMFQAGLVPGAPTGLAVK
jgi:hypothetical protein